MPVFYETEEKESQNEDMLYTFRIPAVSESMAKMKGKVAARIEHVEAPLLYPLSMTNVEEVTKTGEAHGRDVFEVKVRI